MTIESQMAIFLYIGFMWFPVINSNKISWFQFSVLILFI